MFNIFISVKQHIIHKCKPKNLKDYLGNKVAFYSSQSGKIIDYDSEILNMQRQMLHRGNRGYHPQLNH